MPRSTTKSNVLPEEAGTGNKKTVVVKKASLGASEVSAVIEYDGDVPELGTAESINAIFEKGSKAFFGSSTLTAENYEQIQRDILNFGVKKTKKRGRNNNDSDDGKSAKQSASVSVAQQNNVEEVDPCDISDLVNDVNALLSPAGTDAVSKEYLKLRRRENREGLYTHCIKKETESPPRVLMEVDLQFSSAEEEEDSDDSSAEEENHTNDLDVEICPALDEEDKDNNKMSQGDSQDLLGAMMLFSVSMAENTYRIYIYENQLVEELRAIVARKSSTPLPEMIQMFSATRILRDRDTIKDSGITSGCCIDAFLMEKSEEELYNEKSIAVMRFCLKLPADPRRGQQGFHVYARKTATMRSVRDKFAEQRNLDPLQLKLIADGDVVDLDKTAGDCDLENDDQIDVVVINSSNSTLSSE